MRWDGEKCQHVRWDIITDLAEKQAECLRTYRRNPTWVELQGGEIEK